MRCLDLIRPKVAKRTILVDSYPWPQPKLTLEILYLAVPSKQFIPILKYVATEICLIRQQKGVDPGSRIRGRCTLAILPLFGLEKHQSLCFLLPISLSGTIIRLRKASTILNYNRQDTYYPKEAKIQGA